MSIRFSGWFIILGAFAAVLPLALAQSKAEIPRLPNGKPDFNGTWDRPRVGDITKNGNTCGALSQGCKQEGAGELPYTTWGKQQWDDEHRFDYSARCLPWGYTRAWQTEYPVEIMQTTDRVGILWESN